MFEAFRLTVSVASLTFRATVRLQSYLLCSGLTIVAAGVGTLPVSPGLTAGENHYLQAGLSTLLLGMIVHCLVVLPRVLPAARGRWKEEAVLALPLPAGVLTLGAWAGFSAALALFVLAGGVVYVVVAGQTCASVQVGGLLSPLLFALLLGLITVALVTALCGLLPPLPSLAAALIIILLGQAASYWPLLPSILFPPFDRLGPDLFPGGVPGSALPAFLHGGASLLFYLSIAIWASSRAAAVKGLATENTEGHRG
jgi:hypothetical protein